MDSSLSNLINNLSEGIHKIKCKYGHDDEKCETCWIKYKYCQWFLEYISFKDNLIECKSLFCNKNYQPRFDEKLKNQFFNTYKFSNTALISLFYCYKKVLILMNISMFKKNSSSFGKEDFYSHLNMEGITNADYAHAKRLCKDFETKSFRRISWLLCSKQYIIVSWCIWEQ